VGQRIRSDIPATGETMRVMLGKDHRVKRREQLSLEGR